MDRREQGRIPASVHEAADTNIVETNYEIRNASGHLVARHVRRDKPGGAKDVRWSQPDGAWGLNGTPLADLPLYGSESVRDCHPDELIMITEGEKAAQALQEAGLPALGTVTGAPSTPGPDALEVLQDRRVCLWPDNDEPGRVHMGRIAEMLHGVAAEVLYYTWDEAPEKGDAADHPATIGNDPKAVDKLLTALEGAPRWEPPEPEADLVGRLLSTVEAETLRWLWPRRIPLGKLTLIDGDPGNGKSALTIDLAARVSAGRDFPDETPGRLGGVVICSAEDGLADTIRPRLDAAGGDPAKVLALATVPDEHGERMLSIPEDLEIIGRAVERVGASLVIVDPLMAFLSGGTNSHRDQDVRRALAPLAKLAEETGAAVVVVRHLNKGSGGNPLYRGGGSIGIVGAARSALLVAKHPENDERRVLAPLKSNLARPAPSLAFELIEAENSAVRVEWKGETPLTAEALLSVPVDPEERSALGEAKEFLSEALKDGPRWSKAVNKEARDADISEITLKRAKSELGVRSEKEADGSWTWRLPEGKGIEGAQAPKDDPLDPLESPSATEPLSARQEGQGDQEAQGGQVRDDERLASPDRFLPNLPRGPLPLLPP